MADKTLHVLLLDDNEDDAELLLLVLRRAGYAVTWQRCDRISAFASALETPDVWDVILADYELPGFSGLAALKMLQDRNLDIPFIIVSSAIGEQAAVEAMRAGAQDFFNKNNLTRLTAAIDRETREARARRQRRNTEDALRRSEMRFMTVFKASPMPTVIFSLKDGTIMDANERFAKLINWGYADVLSSNICDMPMWIDTFGNAEIMERVNDEKNLRDFETHFKTFNGEIRHVLVSTELLEFGGTYCMLAMLFDITERKQAEDRLRTLQAVTASLASTITPEGVANVIINEAVPAFGADAASIGIMNDDNSVIRILRVVGYTEQLPDHWMTMPLDSDYAPLTFAVRERKPLWMDDTQNGENSRRFPAMREHDTTFRAWAAIPFMVDGKVIGGIGLSFREAQHLDGETRAFVMLLADQCAQAMDRARLYTLEKQARLAAEEANAQKTQFLAMISHELRTPLQSIKGFTSTLLADDVTWTRAEERDFIGTIEQHADRLNELVNQLLEASAAQAGKLQISASAQNFMDILKISTRQVEHLIQTHMLIPNIPKDLPLIRADERRLSQVLTNLIENAAKYSPEHTTIKIDAAANDEFLQVGITDEGAGIAPQLRDKVFEPFYQADRRGKRMGTGLGLAICRYLVEAHGGRIWIESPPGDNGGTTIAFTIPLMEPHTETQT